VSQELLQSNPHLLVVEDAQGQRTVPLQANTYSLGRGSTNSIVIHSRRVSRQHAILLRVTIPGEETYRFRVIDGDLQGNRSTNGLFVNGQRCFSHDLQHRDLIEFGGGSAKAQYLTNSSSIEKASPAAVPSKTTDFTLLDHASKGTIITAIHDTSEAAITRLASFPELSPHPIVEINLSGTITYLNPAALETFPDLPLLALDHPMLVGLIEAVREQNGHFFARQVQVGDQFFEQSVHYLAASDLVRSFITDITQRRKSEEELHKRDRLQQAVADAANKLLTNLDFNQAIAHVLSTIGRAIDVDRAYFFENHPHAESGEVAMSMRQEWMREGVASSIAHWQNQPYSTFDTICWYQALSSGYPVSNVVDDLPVQERAILSRDGIKSTLMVPIAVDTQFWGYIGFDDCQTPRIWSSNEEALLSTMAASISGALQRQQTEAMIRHQAFHDLLTDLPNRSLFSDRLQISLANASRAQTTLAVMFLDLDRFNTINDTLGHTVGDHLLKEVAHRLTGSLREGDTVARWGGDEFTVLLPYVEDNNDIATTAERILEALRTPFEMEGHELFITFSIGIAIYGADGDDAETLIKHADTALYQAKQTGRNNYQFFTTALASLAPEQLAVEKSLRRALERQEFLLYYQPQVNIQTGQVTGMEALVRWQHPELGLVAPKVFIPIAEESGLIIQIGEWVLRTACLQNKAWQDQGLPPICVGVNLSARQFHQPNLPNMIAKILQETGLEPKYLDLEITETTAIQDIDFTCSLLQQMQKIGVQISMDDFGTGYSSLTHLRQFPINTLKIDQSFVKDVVANARDTQIVMAVISLARGLNLSVVAEGVETVDQLNLLQELQCEQAQGYVFNQPLPAHQVAAVLQSTTMLPGIDYSG
jgi:diguanylate cyclase (GGDEF)-like protein